VGMEILTEGHTILTVAERGYGKRTEVNEYRLQSRGGKGIINIRTTQKIGDVSGIKQVTGEEDIMLISSTGNIIRLRVSELPILHRSTQGVRLIELGPEESLVGIARVERETESREDDSAEEETAPEETESAER